MTTNQKIPNRLANEKSPYLLQHANNPVDWYPWGDEAFQKAKTEDKPVFYLLGIADFGVVYVPVTGDTWKNDPINLYNA